MKVMGIIALIFCFWQTEVTIRPIRESYLKAAQDKNEALHFRQLLDSVRETSAPVLVCYKGAAKMLDARYSVNPFTKMSSFNKGKALIEQSILRDTSCVESRFIRFTIQRNLPGFLGYSENIKQDSCMIAGHLSTLTDQDLKNRITNYFELLRTGFKQ